MVTDSVVTITGGYGKPICRRYPCEIYQYKLEQGDDADVIAKRLTMSIYRPTGMDWPASIGR
jgi:hypothetical protein